MSGGALPPFSLPRSQARTVHSASDGQEYRIFVAWPDGTPPPGGFPVVYLLDANAMFGTLVEAIRMRAARPEMTGVSQAVVVGIGHPREGPYDRARRSYDFTTRPPAPPATTEHPTGGAAGLVALLRDTVIPAITRDFPVDTGRQVLIGHSLGGLFVLETLMTVTDMFGGYVSLSPSVWWDRERLLRDASMLVSQADRPFAQAGVDVVISVGEYEQELAPWQLLGRSDEEVRRLMLRRQQRRMVDDTRAVADALAAGVAAGLRVHHEVIAGEDHSSMVPVAISRALRIVLAPR